MIFVNPVKRQAYGQLNLKAVQRRALNLIAVLKLTIVCTKTLILFLSGGETAHNAINQ